MKATTVIALGAALLLAACGNEEVPLPGERIAATGGGIGVIAAAAPGAVPLPGLALPPAQRLASWPMRVGNASNDPAHATLSPQPRLVWSTRIGEGDGRRQRLTADPVSDGARLYALDALGSVTAVTTGGGTVWRRSLVPALEQAGEASGGGLAVVGGTLYASTGFGELHALDAATGAPRWVQRLAAPVTTPKVVDGVIYVVSRDGRGWALDAATGRIRWETAAADGGPVSATAPAPAVAGRIVVMPFGSGEIQAALRQSGVPVWNTAITGAREGVAYAGVTDITGDPVVAGGAIYAGTTSGRIVALDAASGTRIWTAQEGAISPLAVAGGSVFAVSDRAQLLRLDAGTGQVLWRRDLPFYRVARIARREGIHAHHGPLLAGGRLWVASSDGVLRGFDPATGAPVAAVAIPGGGSSRPIAFGDALYVIGRGGTLNSFR